MSETKNSNPVATVVVPCYNGIRTVKALLDSVLAQEVSFNYEVIVVDSSDDGTHSLVEKEFPDVKLIHLADQTYPGSGRNLGVKKARGDFIVFTDSDCIPDKDWLQRIIDRYEKTECDSVGGAVVNGYPYSYVAWVSHLIEFNEWTKNSKKGFVANIPTCNISYKRNVFYDYNIEFCDNFPTEDSIFNWRLISKGGSIYFDPEIRVVHLNRMTLKKLFVHQYRLGKAVAVERKITDLPGKILLKYPMLCLGIPFIRWILALKRLIKCGPGLTMIFIFITPLFLLSAMSWSVGFMIKGKSRDSVIHIHE